MSPARLHQDVREVQGPEHHLGVAGLEALADAPHHLVYPETNGDDNVDNDSNERETEGSVNGIDFDPAALRVPLRLM